MKDISNFFKRYFVSHILLLSLIMFYLFGCTGKDEPVALTITPSFNQQTLTCQSHFVYQNEKWRYQQLQLFIHQVEVFVTGQGWKTWNMLATEKQVDGIALVGENCSYLADEQETNEAKVNNEHWQLQFSDPVLSGIAPSENITRIRFRLGVPINVNHENPLTQPSPLNDSSMFWVWQTGHKFMRIELKSENNDWLFHLGSTGCSSKSPVRAPTEKCLHPNIALIELPFSMESPEITFDLLKLINGLELVNDHSCQSNMKNKHCQKLFEHLGLPVNKGLMVDLFSTGKKQNSQQVFRAK
jgi:uncharacterized repeat protein (TIGR04052 family)